MASIRRVRTIFTGVAGTPYYSNLYFTAGPGDADDAITAVFDFWETLKTAISNDLAWTVEADTPIINDATGIITSFESGTAQSSNGSESSENLPFATQGLLRIFTDQVVSGRRLRGRVFVPGATEALSPDGVPSGPYVALLKTAGDGLIADTSSTGPLVVWSKTHGVSWAADVTSGWSQWAVQRSRRD